MNFPVNLLYEYLFFGFVIKHFICDFPLQNAYQYLNKGTYGHPGGDLHMFIHSVGTFLLIVWPFGFWAALVSAIFDGLMHYHIDWLKVNITKRYDLTPTNSEKYWWLLGLDQMLHYVTYGIIFSFFLNF